MECDESVDRLQQMHVLPARLAGNPLFVDAARQPRGFDAPAHRERYTELRQQLLVEPFRQRVAHETLDPIQ